MRLRAALPALVATLLCAPAAPAANQPLLFHTEIVKDPMSNGIEAFRFLMPNGWVRRGGVQWNLRYSNVASVAMTVTDAARQAINAAGQLSKQIASASDSISRSTREAWRNQQDAYDRVYGELSEQIRGVESYTNPFEGRTVELPNDYRYAWVSSSGEYALSNSAGFDPNVGSNAEWRLLQTAR